MANAHFRQLELEFKFYGASVLLTLDVDEAAHAIVSSETRFAIYTLIKILIRPTLVLLFTAKKGCST